MALNPLSVFTEAPLPPQYGTITDRLAPTQLAHGEQAFASGQALEQQGQSALSMAAAGKLTKPQQASLNIYERGLENTAYQTYENLGLTPSKTTSYLSTKEDIDAHVLAMAQQFIQTTIALGGAELSAGASFMGIGAQEESAAAGELATAGAAQLQQDKTYSELIGTVFSSISKMFSLGLPKTASAGAPTGG